jgi:hypothetical protein
MQLRIFCVAVLSVLSACKFQKHSGSVSATNPAASTEKAVLRMTAGGYQELNPDIVVKKNTNYELTIKNRTQGVGFFRVYLSIYPDGAIDLGNYTPPANAVNISVVGGPSKAAVWVNQEYSMNYFAFIKKGENLTLRISDIPAEMDGALLRFSADSSAEENDLTADSGFTILGKKGLSADIDLAKMAKANPDVARFREGERLHFMIQFLNTPEGFSDPVAFSGYGLTAGANGTGNGTVPGIAATFKDGTGPIIDVTPMIRTSDQFYYDEGGSTPNSKLEIDLSYSKSSGPKILHIELPGDVEGIITGNSSLTPLDYSFAAPSVGVDFPKYPNPPEEDAQRTSDVSLHIIHFGAFENGSAGFDVPLNADGTAVNGNITAAYHTPLVPGQALPTRKDAESYSIQVLRQGKVHVEESGSSYFSKTVIPDVDGIYEYRFTNANVRPHSTVLLDGSLTRRWVVVEDLPSGTLDQFPSNAEAFKPPFAFDPITYLKDAGPLPGDPALPAFKGYVNPGARELESELRLAPDLKQYVFDSDPSSSFPKFPAKEILAAMEEIRETWHETVPRSVHTKRTVRNTNTLDTVGACLNNTAEHWSDITLHYYCQFGEARSCYTGDIRRRAQAIQDEIEATPAAEKQGKFPDFINRLGKIRGLAFEYCKGEALRAAREAKASGQPLAPTSATSEWLWILGVDPGAVPDSDQIPIAYRTSVFRFIMEAPTFSFPYEMQQRVLNAFYRIKGPDGKIVGAETSSLTITEKDCNSGRQSRGIEARDPATYLPTGTQCRSDKTLATGQKAARR